LKTSVEYDTEFED